MYKGPAMCSDLTQAFSVLFPVFYCDKIGISATLAYRKRNNWSKLMQAASPTCCPHFSLCPNQLLCFCCFRQLLLTAKLRSQSWLKSDYGPCSARRGVMILFNVANFFNNAVCAHLRSTLGCKENTATEPMLQHSSQRFGSPLLTSMYNMRMYAHASLYESRSSGAKTAKTAFPFFSYTP